MAAQHAERSPALGEPSAGPLGAPEPHDVPYGEDRGALDGLPVHERAVAGAEVHDRERGPPALEPAVVSGN